jgi:hypothetical protein
MHTLTRNAERNAADCGVRSRARGGRDDQAHTAGARPRGPGVAKVLAIFAVLAALAGCSDSTPGGGGSSTPSLSAPPQSTRGRAEQKAVAAYQEMWQAYAKAGRTANPDDPDLGRYATGSALKTLTDGLKGYRDKAQILKGDLVTNPQVAGASPGTDPKDVTVTDCVDDTKFLVYQRSGELVNNVPGGRRSAKATVTNLGADGWKVTGFGVQAVNTC